MIEAGDPSVSPSVAVAIQRIAALGSRRRSWLIPSPRVPGLRKPKHAERKGLPYFMPPRKFTWTPNCTKRRNRPLRSYVITLPMPAVLASRCVIRRGCHAHRFRIPGESMQRRHPGRADRISFADTLGIMQPHDMLERVSTLRERLLDCKIDLHCHNDYGLALANSMAGIRGGADCIHTSVNGLGERTGIPDLAERSLPFITWRGIRSTTSCH